MKAKIPPRHQDTEAQLALAYVFLASKDASYFTGQVIHVNGGTVINS